MCNTRSPFNEGRHWRGCKLRHRQQQHLQQKPVVPKQLGMVGMVLAPARSSKQQHLHSPGKASLHPRLRQGQQPTALCQIQMVALLLAAAGWRRRRMRC